MRGKLKRAGWDNDFTLDMSVPPNHTTPLHNPQGRLPWRL